MKPAYLAHFHSILPRYVLPQEDAVSHLIEIRMKLNPELVRSEVEKRIRRFGLANAKIKKRGSEVEDYSVNLTQPGSELGLFKEGAAPLLEERMKRYEKCVQSVFKRWYVEEPHKPDHLVHVSCTGYLAPSPAQTAATGWSKEAATQVTHAYHMGCYASLPALRIARGYAQESDSSGKSMRVDIAHNEVCSLHFDPLALDPEQIVVQSLFADGHIRYSVGSDRPVQGFEIEALYEKLIPNSSEQMTWTPTSTHFKMQLSRLVPESIQAHLGHFVEELLEKSKHIPGSPLVFAVHPGGPKIIDAVEGILALTPDQTQESHWVLAEHGNMSSATLPHIWDQILKNQIRADGLRVVSLAFGPGLTLSGAVFRLCRQA